MIYFIEAEACGLIKIGYTDDKPDSRLQTLQVGSPNKLTRLALMAGGRKTEKALHARFRSLRSHGEWFRDSPRIRAYIDRKTVAWIGPIVEGGSMVPVQVVEDWADMLAYTRGIPHLKAEIEELWPRVAGVKIPVARRRPR